MMTSPIPRTIASKTRSVSYLVTVALRITRGRRKDDGQRDDQIPGLGEMAGGNLSRLVSE